MAFFSSFGNPHPDETAEEVRKNGLARLWEILHRDFWRFFTAGLLALAGSLPFLVGMAFAVTTHGLLFAMLFGLIGGAIAGPELCGLADTILRGLRDEPCLWWYTYRCAWRRNAKGALLPGGVAGLLLGTQIFLLFHIEALAIDAITQVALFGGVLLVLGFSIYLWPQLALMELSFGALVKNAALLFLGQLPRSIAALAVQAAYWGLLLEHWKAALPLLPFTSFWLPFVPALFLIYPGIARGFQIEERIDTLQKEELRAWADKRNTGL